MSISVIDNFTINTNKPIDSRSSVADLTARDALNINNRYIGMLVFVESENKYYRLDGGTTNDDWVEFTTSGGSSAANLEDRIVEDVANAKQLTQDDDGSLLMYSYDASYTSEVLMHLNGNTLTNPDLSNYSNTVTLTNITTDISNKIYNNKCYDINNGYITVNGASFSNAQTFRFNCKFKSFPQQYNTLFHYRNSDGTRVTKISYDSTNHRFSMSYVGGGASGGGVAGIGATLATSTLYNFEIIVNINNGMNGYVYVFVNGVLCGYITGVPTYTRTDGTITLFSSYDHTESCNCYADEIELTSDMKHTSNFTPSNTKYTFTNISKFTKSTKKYSDIYDPITPTDSNISISDITTNNVSTSKHGFMPKLSNVSTQVLNGVGVWTNMPSELIYGSFKQSFTSSNLINNTLTIVHGQNDRLIPIRIFNSSYNEVIPNGIDRSTLGTCVVDLSNTTVTGTWYITIGNSNPISSSNWSTTITEASLDGNRQVTITHGIGSKGLPVVVVDASNKYVDMTDRISYPTVNTVLLDFTDIPTLTGTYSIYISIGNYYLTSDTTATITAGSTVAQIQAIIDSYPKNLGTKTLTIAFADGTYSCVSGGINIKGFFNGTIILQPVSDGLTQTTTKGVVFETSGSTGGRSTKSIFMISGNSALITIQGFKFNLADVSLASIYTDINPGIVHVLYNYFYAYGKTSNDNYHIFSNQSSSIINAMNNIVTNGNVFLFVSNSTNAFSYNNIYNTTLPNYGLYATGAIIRMGSTQPGGSTAATSTVNGGQII